MSNRKHCLTLALFCCVLHGQERLLVNGKVFTANPKQPWAESVALRNDTIVSVGSRRVTAASLSPSAEIIDLSGNTLLPGLIDSHVHVVEGGRSLRAADVRGEATTVDGLVSFAANSLKAGRGVRGEILEVMGVPLTMWSRISELDKRFSEGDFSGRAVFLFGLDGHTGWANRALRGRVSLTRDFVWKLGEAERSHFGVDRDGEPNGFVSEGAVDLVRRAMPRPSDRDVIENGRVGIEYLHSLGITSWVDAGARGGALAVYRALAGRGQLSGRVAAFLPLNGGSVRLEGQQLTAALALKKEFSGIAGLNITGVKVFADGVAEHPTHTAAMSKPWRNSGKSADLLFDPQTFAEVTTRADRDGLVVHVHAIGDRAVSATLDGIAAAREKNGNSGLPHTITHLQFVSPADFPRFGKLGVVAAFQLLWASAGPDTVDLIQPYVDPAIYRWQYPARSLFDAGATIAGGSDWFVSSPNPFEAMYQAETRRGPKGVLDAAQCMPREAMLYAYTRNAALAMNLQEQIGSIEPGKKADLTLVSGDVVALPAEGLKKIKVLWTLVGGKWVYRPR